jgi:arsenate reductase-like glutaredoxin family protein
MPKRRPAATLDWFYQRPNCDSCDLARAWLEEHNVTAKETVDCRKEPLVAANALKFARQLKSLIATRGKKIIRLDLQLDSPSGADLRALIVGPSGNLRAPSIRTGQTLVVGFNAAAWSEVLR